MILLLLALAWLAGTIAAALGLALLWPLLIVDAVGVALGFAAQRRWRLGFVAAGLTLIALAAMIRYEAAVPPAQPGGIAELNGRAAIELRGVIVAEPEPRERSQRFPLRVTEYRDPETKEWHETAGKVLVTTKPFPELRYGDALELTAKLETPPRFAGFDYREYLARRGIVSLALFPSVQRTGESNGSAIVSAMLSLRRPLSDSLARSLPEPEAALAQGILLGERSTIPRDLTDDFNRAGISHLVAISGYNVMLLAGFAVAMLSWLLGRRWAIVAAMALILLYAAFVGGSPSVLRATVMGEVMLGAWLVGRPGSALSAVMLTGGLLTAWQPLIIEDVSFQLSFAATIGIVLVSRPLAERFEGRLALLPGAWPAFLAEQMSVTTAATLAVLPIVGANFGRISLIALPANLIAVPVFPLTLLGGGFVALCGVVSSGLGRFFNVLAYLPLSCLVRIGRAAADLPGASLTLHGFGVIEAVLLYGLIALVLLVLLRLPALRVEAKPALRMRPALGLALAALVIAAFVWWRMLAPEEATLRVTVLDVGQGDAILIETPSGVRILVDGGPSATRLGQALGRELPASARRFDLVVLTHSQDDHVTGLVDVLERYEVKTILMSPLPGESAASRAWRRELAERSSPVHIATAREWADLGDGVKLQVIGPPPVPPRGTPDDLNNASVVLRLVYGDISFLLTGDLAAAGEAALLSGSGRLDATVLKVGHHGSDGSTTPAFLRAVQPKVAVISVGAENSFGHPSPTLLLRLAGVPFLRTDENGSVRFRTDGAAVWVEPQRGTYRKLAAVP